MDAARVRGGGVPLRALDDPRLLRPQPQPRPGTASTKSARRPTAVPVHRDAARNACRRTRPAEPAAPVRGSRRGASGRHGVGGRSPVRRERALEGRRRPADRLRASPRRSRNMANRLGKALDDEPALRGLLRQLPPRNLLRGYVLSLPTGQAAAEALGVDAALGGRAAETSRASPRARRRRVRRPDAAVVLRPAGGRDPGRGNHLGQTGSRIVAETIVGLLQGDPTSYLNDGHALGSIPGRVAARRPRDPDDPRLPAVHGHPRVALGSGRGRRCPPTGRRRSAAGSPCRGRPPGAPRSVR